MKNIGLKRGTVALREYQAGWVRLFEIESRRLKKLLGKIVSDIQHIGSTAVPGLVAKPIIDIDMAVKSLKDITHIQPIIEGIGYTYRENGSDEKQVLFVKGPEVLRTHYLHITELGSSIWRNDLAFRDYLRTHPKAVKKYADLKEKLAKKYFLNRAKYTAGKKAFILKTLKTARSRA